MKSIRFKFYTFITTLLLTMFVIMNTIPLQSSRDTVFEEKQNSLSSQGSAIASALSRLDKLSTENIGEVLGLLEMDGFDRIAVADETGSLIFDSQPDKIKISDIDIALKGQTVFRSNFTGDVFDSSFTTPMSAKNEIMGVLYIKELDAERASILMGIQNRIRVISIVVCVITLILSTIFSRTLLKRFTDLAKSMRIVADGDYSYRHSVSGQDEISELGNEFNELTEKLQTTEQQRRRFVSDASHELKTPLASIRLLSDSIVQSDRMDRDTVREFVTDIGNEAERLQHTTEKLLSLSRMDDDVFVAEEPVDMKQVTLDAYVLLRPLAEDKQVKLNYSLDEGCVIMATTEDAFHIVFNLIENAIKYNVKDGSVDISLSSDGEKVNFEVKDTGIGIPEEERLNVFTRFYRIDKARSRESGGSGLGLSIVHDAVKSHDGTITVGANKPQGSIFTVSFPVPTPEETGI